MSQFQQHRLSTIAGAAWIELDASAKSLFTAAVMREDQKEQERLRDRMHTLLDTYLDTNAELLKLLRDNQLKGR